MSRKAVSVTLQPDNPLWLKSRVKVKREGSLREALDDILTEARAGAGASAWQVRSVVGHARIPGSEKALSKVGTRVAALFERSASQKEKMNAAGRGGGRARPAAPRRGRA